MNDIKKLIEDYLQKYPTAKATVIASKLGIEAKTIRKILKTMTPTEKNIPLDKKDKNIGKAYSGKLFYGTIDSKNKFFAFFIPDDKSMEDVFIHNKNLNGAVHSDKVAVQIGVYRGKKEAIVEKIIERGIKQIIGVADFGNHGCRIIPFSKNFTTEVTVKNTEGVKDGDIVICSIEKFPEKKSYAIGKILERICHISDSDADNLMVLHKFGINRNFPKHVEEEVVKIAEANGSHISSPLENFTTLFTVTIDGDTAKDFDDAISVEETPDGFTLYVHIADVSRFVPKGTVVDEEAKKRGTSVYFPQFAAPMLPEILSNDKCSLRPHEERFTVTAKIFYDKIGNPKGSKFYRSIIKSHHRLTYAFVNRVLSGEENGLPHGLGEFLQMSEKLAKLILQRRIEKGYIDFNGSEINFEFNDKGEVASITPYERGFAERLIEVFMIAANEEAASFLETADVPGVYRIHGEPDTKKLEGFLETVKIFGLVCPPLEYPVTNKTVAELAEVAANSKYGDLLSSSLIRCMMRAEYSVENKGHFGLNSKAYTHFTSPIRRYPDLLVHRAILNKLGQGEVSESLHELESLASELSLLERAAEDAEYEITVLKKMEYLQNNPDEIFSGFINRVTSDGLFVYLEKLMATTFVDFVTMDYDTFYTDEFSAFGRGTGDRYRVGDKLNLTFESANIFLLQINMRLETHSKKRNKRG